MQLKPDQLTRTFADLLGGHRSRMEQRRMARREGAKLRLGKLLDGFQEARSAWAREQKAFAQDFNVLQVLGRDGDELTHSRILAWLLDRRIEHGSHAQGNLGLRLFLQELGGDLQAPVYYADEPYWVRREVSGDESRVDIEIAARGKFIIHIENKIWSLEGDRQTEHEWSDLERRGDALGIPTPNRHAVFLTLDGSPPMCPHFMAISWSRIAAMLERFADEAQPPEVKLFVAHYAKAVRMLAAVEPQMEQEADDEE